MAPTIDDLFRRATAQPELEPSGADQVGGARLLGHVERVFVAHVDHRGAELDPARPGAHRREQRKGGGELASEMMDATIGAVRAKLAMSLRAMPPPALFT